MILTLTSNNSEFSWMIKKNPNTQKETNRAFEKDYRNGKIYGWYLNENQFRMLFQQKNGEASFYKNQDNNYLNADKVVCAFCCCAMIGNMIDDPIRSLSEKDIKTKNSLKIETIYLQSNFISNAFKKHLKSIDIDIVQIAGKLHSVTFSGETTLYYLLNCVLVFCLMQSIEDQRVIVDLSESLIKKYVKCLKAIDAPYYVVYSFLSRCVTDRKTFNLVCSELKKDNWSLFYGNTQKQRFDAIRPYLKKSKSLHDIGCGELFYSKYLCQDYENIYAWETSDFIQDKNKSFLKKKGIKNINLKSEFSLESIKEISGENDLLVTEMFEHQPFEYSKQMMLEFSKINFNTLIITLPNRNFNKHYLLEDKFRHPDHYWEPTFEEACDLVDESFKNHYIEKIKIGDIVDLESVSSLFVIKKYGEKNV